MSIEIIPSLLVESKNEFETKLRQIEDDTEIVHVDILDGTLFPNTTWFDAQAVGAMKTKVKYELHLMCENPLPIINDWQEHVAGTQRAIVHAEIDREVGAVLNHVRDVNKLETGVAINPETPLEEVHALLHHINMLLIMGVHPGFSGQKFEGDYILEKIEAARKHLPNLAIEIDGGVTEELVPRLIKAGATHICAASLLFGVKNPTERLKEIKAMA